MRHSAFFVLLLTMTLHATPTPQYYCTAADAGYFDRLMNLIASIHTTNYERLDTIAVFDLGLNQKQIQRLRHIKKVQVFELEKYNPAITTPFSSDNNNSLKRAPGWYAFKDVALQQALGLFPYVLWIDAGSTVLKSLVNLFNHIEQQGYFFCTVGGCPVNWGSTKILHDTFNLDTPESRWILEAEMVMGGVFGIKRDSVAHQQVLTPMYQAAQDKELCLYKDDGTTPNGFGTGRHDQPLRSIHVYLAGLTVGIQDASQQTPIMLNVDNKQVPFYITWDKHHVCEKTDIFSSRGSFEKYYYLLKNIHYKP